MIRDQVRRAWLEVEAAQAALRGDPDAESEFVLAGRAWDSAIAGRIADRESIPSSSQAAEGAGAIRP